jgi:hypothetical protein
LSVAKPCETITRPQVNSTSISHADGSADAVAPAAIGAADRELAAATADIRRLDQHIWFVVRTSPYGFRVPQSWC